MFIKVPIYVDYRGSIQDPALLIEAIRTMIEGDLLSGKLEKKYIVPSRKRVALKGMGGDPEKIFLIKREKVLDGLR